MIFDNDNDDAVDDVDFALIPAWEQSHTPAW